MVFSIPSFVGVGDDYDAKPKEAAIKAGRSLAVPGPKRGTGPDALFGKQFQSIHEGDPYIDPGTAEKRAKREAAKKRVVDQGFRYASPPKKNSGAGGYYGTFHSTPLPHEADYIVPRKGEAPPRKEIAKRPIYTAPTKKGGFGVANTLLSKEGTDYVADFYDSKRMQEKADHEKHKKLLKGGAPFKGTVRRGYTFDEAMGTGASKCYTMTQPMAPRKAASTAEKKEKKDVAPWRPSGQIPKALPPIDYREDPYDGYDPAMMNKKKPPAETGGKPGWRPNGVTNDTWYTKSIAFARL